MYLSLTLGIREPPVVAVGRPVSGCCSCSGVDKRAFPARRRSVGFNASLARGGRARLQVCGNRVAPAEVDLVRRLSAKRRMGKHRVVFLDVERD